MKRQKNNPYLRAVLLVVGVLAAVLTGRAQSVSLDSLPHYRFVTRATMVGIGGANLYDTYLSPREYSGTELHVAYESFRSIHYSPRIFVRHLVQGSFTKTEKSETESGNMLGAMVQWNGNGYYRWTPLNHLHLYVGGGVVFQGGGIYNTRNSNNPAQAKVSLQLAASGMCSYRFEGIHRFPLEVRYACTLPFLGVQFSPEYMESYYEMFSENSFGSKNLRATSFGNALSFQHLLTIDFPLLRHTFRVGYQGNYRQSELCGLRYHHYSNTFFIGYVQHLYRVKEKDALRQQFNR
jgi:hypothetical protein